VKADTPSDFRIYSGEDANTLDVMRHGGVGVISVASHIVGQPMKRMIAAFASGDVETARRMETGLMPVFKGLFTTTNPILVKAALRLRGFDCGGLRLPLVEATPAEIEELRRICDADVSQVHPWDREEEMEIARGEKAFTPR
jgi:4-hydroxy-tetrahydrodipicolinate synthase